MPPSDSTSSFPQSTASPPSPPTTDPSVAYNQMLTTLSLALVVTTPLALALPPRRLTPTTFILASSLALSANHLTREYTGRSVTQRVGAGFGRLAPTSLPTDRAREYQRQKLRERELDGRVSGGGMNGAEGGRRGVVERVWMGGESEGWKEQRAREDREALERGEGYGDIILKQIWEVWNWGKGADGEEESDVKSERPGSSNS